MVNNVLHSFVSVELIRTNRPDSPDTCALPPHSYNPFRIRTYKKRARNSFRIRTYKTQDLKSFRIRTYKKRWGGGVQTVNRNLRQTLAESLQPCLSRASRGLPRASRAAFASGLPTRPHVVSHFLRFAGQR